MTSNSPPLLIFSLRASSKLIVTTCINLHGLHGKYIVHSVLLQTCIERNVQLSEMGKQIIIQLLKVVWLDNMIIQKICNNQK